MCEVFGATGYIRTAYTYSPYGQVTATGNVTQPIQWSSEFNDDSSTIKKETIQIIVKKIGYYLGLTHMKR